MTQALSGYGQVFSSRDGSSPLKRSAPRYALAIVATLIAFATTLGLKREWPAPVFLFFVLAIALSTWYGGRGPAVVATAISLVLTKYAFKEPVGTLRVNQLADLIPFIVFTVVALIIISTIEALRRARAQFPIGSVE